jgi:hypothetical protein
MRATSRGSSPRRTPRQIGRSSTGATMAWQVMQPKRRVAPELVAKYRGLPTAVISAASVLADRDPADVRPLTTARAADLRRR